MPGAPLFVLGTGVWAEEVADVARDAGFSVEGFVENLNPERCEATVDDLPIRWVDEVAKFARTHLVVAGLGTTHRHRFTAQAEGLGFEFATVIHPAARVSSTSRLAPGCFVNAGAVVAAKARLGAHVIVNRGATIGHHTEVSNFCTIAPGTNIGGLCLVGPRAWIGIGATVIDRIRVGEGCVIGAGAVVTRDVPDRVLAFGVPAKVVKEGIEGR